MTLHTVTVVVNYTFLIAAVWLGVYIVTRSPRSPIAWLTGLTLWSLAGLFLNVLLALNPPPLAGESTLWQRFVMPFWPEGALESGSSGWLQGWLVAPALAFWHHATVLMRPGKVDRWRIARILLGYGVAIAAIIIHQNSHLIFDETVGDPLYLNSMRAGPLFLIFLGFLLVFTGMSLGNLLRSARLSSPGIPKKQYNVLILATLVAGLAGPIGLMGLVFVFPVPMVVLAILLGIAVCLLGIGVARYSAVMEGRTIRRDFLYNVVSVGLITLLYLAATWMSVELYSVPVSAFVFVVLLAIVTHSLIDIARRILDRFFYQQEKRELRANLRSLASLVGELSLEENLNIILESLCTTVRATYGLVLLFEDGEIRVSAKYRWSGRNLNLDLANLLADDVQHIEPGMLPDPFGEAALLVPLYADVEQIGALVLGRPVNGIQYSPADVDLLLYPCDQMAFVIGDARREAEYMAQLAQLTGASERVVKRAPERIPVKVVEGALRNLYDYAYLGDSPLVDLRLVRNRLPKGTVTHLDQGKGVQRVLSLAVEKLKPPDEKPCDPPPREWYPYIILHSAYLEDKPNRDIMAQLYISEGTFNRTRRSAIRSVTRVLEEMEAALH